MQIIDSAQTRRFLAFDRLIPALASMFNETCEVPLRHMHAIGGGDSPEGTLLIMPAWQSGGYLGIKAVTIFPDNTAAGLPGLHSTFTLFDAKSGVPLAVLDGNEITSRRTAAASALAARSLSRPDSRRLLVVGAGRVASLLPDAYRTVRAIDQVRIWDIDRDRAEALARQVLASGLSCEVADDLAEAVRWTDIVTCATLSTVPLVRGEWLQPGVHLDLIGGFKPEMRETDDECFRVASVFIDTDEVLLKAGDLLQPIRNGVISRDDVRATLEQLCRGVHPGRVDPQEITVFKAVGTALEDLAAAALVFDGCRESEA